LDIDATKFLKNGENHIAVDASVYSSQAGKYIPYINYGGLHGGNNAVLDIGATIFVYDGSAADAIKAQSKPLTSAEKALVNGCSVPAALHPPTVSKPEFGSFLERGSATEKPAFYAAKVQPHSSVATEPSIVNSSDGRYDFEAKAPWYLYDEKTSGKPGIRAGAQVVPVFTDSLIQISSREIRIKVDRKLIPEDWSQLGLQIRLQRPGEDSRTDLVGMELDDWDRVGSFGVLFEDTARTTTDAANSMVKLHPSEGRRLRKRFDLL
jgi:hypothetical protein